MNKTIVLLFSLLLLSCSMTKLDINERLVSSLDSENMSYSNLYNDLNTDEVVLPAPRTLLKYQKSAGPLSCQKTIDIRHLESIDCKISNKVGTHKEIYDSLSINETVIPSNRMTLRYIKKNEGISCTKSSTMGKSPIYHCVLLSLNHYECLPYQEMCRASFCTGGHKMVDQKTNKVVDHFRHFDYGEDTLSYCQSFLQ